MVKKVEPKEEQDRDGVIAWVLEDTRCRNWSSVPMYLDKGFYSQRSNWSPYTTNDPHHAMRFPTCEKAQQFTIDKELPEAFVAVEHKWMTEDAAMTEHIILGISLLLNIGLGLFAWIAATAMPTKFM